MQSVLARRRGPASTPGLRSQLGTLAAVSRMVR
jgi:hypothetical protein